MELHAFTLQLLKLGLEVMLSNWVWRSLMDTPNSLGCWIATLVKGVDRWGEREGEGGREREREGE